MRRHPPLSSYEGNGQWLRLPRATRPQTKEIFMTKHFGAGSTTDDVLAGIDLSGKRVLVTGVSAGLGVETARALVAHGAQVVGAARDLSKAEIATTAIRAQATGGGSLEL